MVVNGFIVAEAISVSRVLPLDFVRSFQVKFR